MKKIIFTKKLAVNIIYEEVKKGLETYIVTIFIEKHMKIINQHLF